MQTMHASYSYHKKCFQVKFLKNILSVMPDLGSYLARYIGNKEAVYDYASGKHYTFSQLHSRAKCAAEFFTEKLKLKKGDRVAFCSENAAPFLDVFFSGYKTGIIMTTYNYLLGNCEISDLIERERPSVIFYSQSRRALIDELRNSSANREYIAISGQPDPKDRYVYSDVVEYKSAKPVAFDTPSPEDIQLLIHTGGTTGFPKSAMISYRAIYYNAISEILSWNLCSTDSSLAVLPFFHTAGWNVLMFPILLAGGRVIITPAFNPETVLRIIRDERPTTCICVETIYIALLNHPDFEKTDMSCFRFMISGAAPVSKPTLQAFWDKGVNIMNAYGMTEVGPNNVSPPFCAMSQEQIRDKWDAIGVPMPFNNYRIVDDNDNDVPCGQPGELLLEGYLTFSGYWEDEKSTSEIMKDGWVRTGDIVMRDEDGYFWIRGRKKNIYITGGENIFPIEIEHILAEHPAIASSCVFGVPDERYGEAGKALVVLKQGVLATKDEVQFHILERSSKIKVPRYVRFVDAIPRNAAGKVDYRLVREKYGEACD